MYIRHSNKKIIPNKINYFSVMVEIIKWINFIIGTFILALGAGMMIHANLGVSTWDVLHIGLADQLSLSVGTSVQIIGLLLILLKYLLDRRRLQIGTFINAILIGYFLDVILFLDFLPDFDGLLVNSIYLCFGITMMANGSGMYVGTGKGAGPRDGFTLALSERIGWSIRLVRSILEATILSIGWLLGGPVSVGTFASILLIGPILQKTLLLWRKVTKKLDDESVKRKVNKEKSFKAV
ncbi:membrane protein [Aquibacillus koreensis]|uniref:Membrane protein n=1 Tax=Aquibacillus koreensis TaxID=279446 RepID=A0A9X3WJQ0_9BACI|nr:membrane protein [Aquibacillus koreensis]MCT2537149.1 membrane protein [Aquibacillus koreensis]MDC3419868.1 membrane protein [Aquibacillus koreensis]